MTALPTYRDTIRKLSPWWLRGRVAGSVLFAIAAQCDALADATVAAVKARFPNLDTPESLPLIGRERRIRRGRLEGEAAYARRLIPWLDVHRKRGGPYGLLEQLHGFYAPNHFPIELRYHSGRRYLMSPADGSITRDDIVWSPPGDATRWARWWLIYTWPTPVDSDGKWQDPGTWSDGGVWDSNLSATEVRDLRLVPREWNAAHAIGRLVLVTPLRTVSIGVEGA